MTKDKEKEKEKEEKKKNRRLSSDGKRAAHVKWDGKTIALGTFPDAEAELACKRAKSLTRSWRAMFPKPTVEEVKKSLEKIGIRVVNDRPGRQPRDKSKDTISTTQPVDAMKMQGDGTSTSTSTSVQQPQRNLNGSSNYFLPLPQTASPVGQERVVDPEMPITSGPFPSSKQQADLHNQKQDPGSESDSDDDGNLDETYETLERHHSNLADEIVEIRALMEFYGEKRERRRMRRKRLAQQEQRNQRSMMKRRRGVGPEPLDPSLASGLGRGGLGSGLSDTGGLGNVLSDTGGLGSGLSGTGGLGNGLSSTEGLGSGSSDTGGLGNVLNGTGELGSGLSGTGGLASELSSTGGLGSGLSGTVPPLSMNIAYTPENTQQGDMPPPQPQNTRFAVDNLPEDWRC